jgi:multidrug efflux system outer membrane protein
MSGWARAWVSASSRELQAVAVAGLLAGCTVGPDYVAPETRVPDLWTQRLSRGLVEGQADLRTWWTAFDDPELDRLITRATEGNLDIRQAVARIHQARANLGIASGELFPEVDGIGSAETSRISNQVAAQIAPPQDRTDTEYIIGLDATWEIDFWGRIRRNIESQDASLGASIEDYRDTLVVLYAEVASDYVQVRTLQARIASALDNVAAQRGTLQYAIERNRAGLAPELDVRQAQLNLATTEATVPTLRSALAQTINSLAVLLGEYPAALQEELAPLGPIPPPPEEVTVSLPADVLRQRPDIRSAERQLAAQTAQIGVAIAQLFPQFTFSGSFAFDSFSFDNWIEKQARTFSFGPAFQWSIFDAGRIRSNIEFQDALTEEALVSYEQTVLSAVEEVESAIAAYVQERDRLDALQRSVVAARQAVALVETLYRTGLTDFNNVLVTQQNQFEQEDLLAQSQGLVIQDLIEIYQALGGGWAPEVAGQPAPTT